LWSFINGTYFFFSVQYSGEKSSKSSSFSRKADRVLSGIEKIRRKMVGRKVDLLFLRQSLEYGCCECGRYDDPTKEMNDGGFKMTKVLKDMLYCIYKSAPGIL
jgi:ribosomal protein L44E